MANPRPTLTILVGLPSSGKSFLAKKQAPTAIVVSRDSLGGRVKDHLPIIEEHLKNGSDVIADNMHITKESRAPYLEIAKRTNASTVILFIDTTIEECQTRYFMRTWKKYQSIFLTTPVPKKDPNVFSAAVFFRARKQLEPPTADEGFDTITTVSPPPPKFDRATFPNKALFLDIDGTLRKTDHLPNKYPTDPSQVELIADAKTVMRPILEKYINEGYYLIGVSNQSGISKGIVTEEQVVSCMEKTKELLKLNLPAFPICYCPHRPAPITCYCRKPQTGIVMEQVMKLGINPKHSIMVGDQTSDKTMAGRLNMKFMHATDFWNQTI